MQVLNKIIFILIFVTNYRNIEIGSFAYTLYICKNETLNIARDIKRDYPLNKRETIYSFLPKKHFPLYNKGAFFLH